MHNENTQALPKIKSTHKFSSLNFPQNFIMPPPTPKPYIVLNVKNNTK